MEKLSWAAGGLLLGIIFGVFFTLLNPLTVPHHDSTAPTLSSVEGK